jgi:hypothetical protein
MLIIGASYAVAELLTPMPGQSREPFDFYGYLIYGFI